MSEIKLNNGWIKAPANPEELPWPVKAGKRQLWFIVFEVFDQWPERRFTIAASLSLYDKRFGKNCLIDKDNDQGTGIYYGESVLAYQEQPGEP